MISIIGHGTRRYCPLGNKVPDLCELFANAQGQKDRVNVFSDAAVTIGHPGYTPWYFSVNYYGAYASEDKPVRLSYFPGADPGYERCKPDQPGHGLPVTEYSIDIDWRYEVLSRCEATGAATDWI